MSGFSREVRITRGPELQRVMKEGKRIRTRFLDVRMMPSPFGVLSGRIGIIVPKLKHTAVERNRLKRRLRELARTEIIGRGARQDLVFIARAHTYQATFEMLRADVQKTFRAVATPNDDVTQLPPRDTP